MAEAAKALSEQLFPLLQQEKLVLLSTIDHETGAPHTSTISWVYAPEPQKLRFSVDKGARIVPNIQANSKVTATFFGGGTVNVIYGTAVIVADPLEGVPLKLVCIDIEIDTVRDALFYGSRISVEPAYEKTYDERAADKLDGQVFEAMQKA